MLAHPHPSLALSYTLSPSASSQLLANPKMSLTSEGCLLKCLLNVFPSAAFFFFQYPFLVLSLLHSCSLMCKHVRSLNPLCFPYCTECWCALLPYYSNCLRKFSKTGGWQYAVISSGVLNVTDLASKKNHVLHTTVWCLPYFYAAVRLPATLRSGDSYT